MRLTESEYAELQKGRSKPKHFPTPAKGRQRQTGMNKTEALYASYLEVLKKAGQVLWYRFEGLKLRLADNTFYTPDFFVMVADGALEVREVKGHWEDDARVKIKVAAEMYPFRFIAVKKDKSGWIEEEI